MEITVEVNSQKICFYSTGENEKTFHKRGDRSNRGLWLISKPRGKKGPLILGEAICCINLQAMAAYIEPSHVNIINHSDTQNSVRVHWIGSDNYGFIGKVTMLKE